MSANPSIVSTPEVDALIAAGAPVAIGVSGGKDSQACALATFDHLDALGHSGPRVLIHSDLGDIEWAQSLPVCQRLAAHLDTELMVVRRRAGGMIERWEGRWNHNVARYQDLRLITMLLPWSTPGMRFCTSELKTQVITAALKARFRGQTILNVTGVRREESAARAKGTVANLDARNNVLNWRPISDWKVGEVFAAIRGAGLEPHEAYVAHDMSRVSCKFCIMSSGPDLVAATRVPEAADVYRRLVDLEIRSTFGFQGSRWLGDVRPELLSPQTRSALVAAKMRAKERVAIEKEIPRDLLFSSGWPTRMPTPDEAVILASVRRRVSDLLDLDADHLDAPSVLARYERLMKEKADRDAQRAEKASRAARKAGGTAIASVPALDDSSSCAECGGEDDLDFDGQSVAAFGA